MNSFPGLRLALSLSLGLAPSAAFAWSETGHKTIALIAQDRLSPRTAQAIAALLGSATLESIAPCPDRIKRPPLGPNGQPNPAASISCGGLPPMTAMPETASWHFINDNISESPTIDSEQNHCPGGNCLVDAIRSQMNVLQTSSDAHQRQLALMFVVHLMGDLFQPMHCVVKSLGGTSSDGGGNAEMFPSFAEPGDKFPMSLHHLWDTLIQPESVELSADPRALATQLEATMAKPGSGARFTLDGVPPSALESFNIAKQTIYPEYQQNHGQTPRPAYQAQMQPIVYDRLRAGGAALADLLEAAFANAPAAPPPAGPTTSSITNAVKQRLRRVIPKVPRLPAQ